MFKKIVLALSAVSLLVSPTLEAKSYSSGGSFSRSSSYSSSRSSSYSSPSYSTPRYTSTPTRTYTPTSSSYNTPRYSSGNSYRPSYRPSYTPGYRSSYNPNRNVPQVNNHYYNNSFGHPLGSPWFWMWAMDHHRPQTVVVSGGGAPVVQGGAPADPGMYQGVPVDNGPGFFMTIFWGFVNLAILVTLVVLLIWAFIRIRRWWRTR